ncbi:SGNH/GDSL hydrolase family protein [Methylobacterium phyllosphaerae]
MKEFAPSTASKFWPPDWYMDQVNNSFVRKEFVINTDQNGFIKPHADCGECRNNLVVLGDSVVESMYMDESLRMCSALDRKINYISQDELRVLNAGYSGSTLLHMFNILLNKILPLRPTAILVMAGIVDVDAVARKASFWSKDKWLEPIISLDSDNPFRDNDNADEPRFQHRYAILALIHKLSLEFALPIYFATVPHLQIYEGEWVSSRITKEEFRNIANSRRLINNTTRKFCIKNDITLFDLELALMDRNDIFYDYFHFNELGGEAAAQALMDGGLVTALRFALEQGQTA